MKVSAAHLEAFIGAIEDNAMTGSVEADAVGITLYGSCPVGQFDVLDVKLRIAFEGEVPPSAFPASMLRAHAAAALNREIARRTPSRWLESLIGGRPPFAQ